MSGRLELITGVMFAGKTRELIERAERARIAGRSVEAFKPSIDDRYDEEEISSHAGRSIEASALDPEESGYADKIASSKAEVVVVDEANFFDSDLVDACRKLADAGKRVIVSRTDQTFRGEPFEPLPELYIEAEDVEKLNAVCVQCGGVATRNQRLIDGKPASVDSPTVMVGAEDTYEARCRHCHELEK